MKLKFKEKKFSEAALQMIALINQVIGQYRSRLTARQVYYWFVSHVPNFPNTPGSYDKMSDLISEGRLCGLVDWDAIEDRGRVVEIPLDFKSTSEAIGWLANDIYHVPRWGDQPRYAELWVEKQALSGVLYPIAKKIHVPFMATKGYNSQSAMFEAAMRLRLWQLKGKEVFIFYLGDFDPSGEDMVRDIRDRLNMFGVQQLTVEKLALTWDQVQQYQPPPNPAKIRDPRAAAYIERYGDESWEVDALDPDVIEEIIVDKFKSIVDVKLMKAAKKREKIDKKYLLSLAPDLTDQKE
ncbi:MAG: hypothetical protein WAV09_03260 [Minisyncoccia bacterium]